METVKKRTKKKSFKETLVELKLIENDMLDWAVKTSSEKESRLEEFLIQEKIISEDNMAKALSHQYQLEYIELAGVSPSQEALLEIPEDIAHKYSLLPVVVENNIIKIAVSDPLNVLYIAESCKNMKYNYKIVVASKSKLEQKIVQNYKKKESIKDLTKEFLKKEKSKSAPPPAEGERTKIKLASPTDGVAGSEEGTVASIVTKIIERSVAEKASDIHFEPDNDLLRVRERIDGILHEREVFPLDFHNSIISRLKIMGNMDIAERRSPQDGRFKMDVETFTIDCRISSMPTVKGEKIVLRILDKKNLKVGIEDLNMTEVMISDVKKMLAKPHGIVLITGPTGSGKTTTVYSMLNYLNSIERNIITVEDPVEYLLPVINQVQINTKIGLDFPKALRTILRQDPDVIMVGEIRDQETADIAIRAALTGHLVISTLHTNDSLSTIDRLIDIGIEPFLITSSILGIMAQRLVRKLCPNCKIEDKNFNSRFKEGETHKVYKAKGCEACSQTGFSGRIPVFEMVTPNAEINSLIKSKSSAEEIYPIAKKYGFKTLQEDAYLKVLQGITSVQEMGRSVGLKSKYGQSQGQNAN